MSEQAQLGTLTARWREMLGCQFRPRLVEAQLVTSGLETSPNHPGNRPSPGHPLAELGIVVLATAHVADQAKHVTVPIREICHQPLAEQVAYFDRKPQQHV